MPVNAHEPERESRANGQLNERRHALFKESRR